MHCKNSNLSYLHSLTSNHSSLIEQKKNLMVSSNTNDGHQVDQERIARAVREIILAIGEDPNREGLLETPERVARMYAEIFSGIDVNPSIHLQKFFTEKYDEIVLVRDIAFNSMCEHHLLPFMGKVHIGYIPDGKVVGLSKLARVVETVSKRPQLQERMTEEIANLLVKELSVKGAGVIIEAVHTCMTVRGVRKQGATCVTSSLYGSFKKDPRTRGEFLHLVHQK